MLIQIEITTRCNFDCHYCVGRLMRQGDMSFEQFQALLAKHVATYGVPRSVSLQGEGEPTLHKSFFEMVEAVRAIGSSPTTITNGTYKHPEQFIGKFSQIGISVDSLNPEVATKIGRYNLPRVMRFAETLAPHMQVTICSVGDPAQLRDITAWCQAKGMRHSVQPLQRKADYRVRYPDMAPAAPAVPEGRFSCAYLHRQEYRHYDLAGIEMPCSYIKDTSVYEGLSALIAHQAAGSLPKSCEGCRFAMSGPARTS
jgi:pyruvate-formate lyase-activating enzyme